MDSESFNRQLEFFSKNQKEKKETVGTFKNGKICSEYMFQHVIQQTYNRKKLFYPGGAAFYENKIKSLCPDYDVVLVCQVVMPTHTHEIFISRNIEQLSAMRAVACRTTSQFIKNEFREKGYEVPSKVFARSPGYVAIRNRPQLLGTLKYIRDNDVYLQKTSENGKPCKAPYSCFEHWRYGHYKPFFIKGLESLFGISAQELVELLDSDMERVLCFAKQFETREFMRQDEKYFKIRNTCAHLRTLGNT